jgi:pimeloyl-ACP methyl ester carboxylesterase
MCSIEMMAKDSIKLADHIGWQKFHLVGASMGMLEN